MIRSTSAFAPARPSARAALAAVIPCFNDGATLLEAVQSARQQDRLNELVVVNDGSTESFTIEVLRALEEEGTQVVHRPNGGLGAARMSGVQATSGEYLFCLDADDRLLPGSLQALADELRRRA